MLIGTTSGDLALTRPDYSYFGDNADKAKTIYSPDGTLDENAIKKLIGVDITMHEPARFVTQKMTEAGNSVWLYRFDYVAESEGKSATKGAEHATELPYLFNTLDARYQGDVTAKDQKMADIFHTYFANFAKSGNPNDSELSPWTKYDANQPDLMMFKMDTYTFSSV